MLKIVIVVLMKEKIIISIPMMKILINRINQIRILNTRETILVNFLNL